MLQGGIIVPDCTFGQCEAEIPAILRVEQKGVSSAVQAWSHPRRRVYFNFNSAH